MSLLIPGTNSIKETGYDVDNSVRVNASSTPHMAVTQGTPTNVDKYTFSVWVKRADIGAGNSKIFSVSSGSATGEEKLEFNQDDLIWRQTDTSGNTNWERVTDRKFRDAGAWYNIIVAYDSSQGTAADRCKMYINGVQETSFSGSPNPSSGQDSYTNTSGRSLKFFALHSSLATQTAGGYFAEMVYIDGQRLDQTSFGQFDSNSPTVWVPKDVSGLTFGNNGFYCEFKNSSALGTDTSGNSNNLSTTNFSTTDQSTDTCTNNSATFNPLNPSSSNISFAEGSLTFKTDGSASGQKAAFGNFGVSTGKWYAEFKMTAVSTQSGSFPYAGVAGIDKFAHTYIGANLDSVAYNTNGAVYSNESEIDSGEAGYGAGNIVGVAADITNKKIYIHVNGTYINSQNPVSGANGYTLPTNTGGFYTFAVSLYGANGTWEANFGSPSFSISSGNTDDNNYGNFEYDVPAGFYSLNTKNLAEFG